MNKTFKLSMDRKLLLKTLSFIKKNYKLANASKNKCAENITIATGSTASVDERGYLSSALIRYVTTEMDLSADVEAFHCEGEITLPLLLLYDLVRCAVEDIICIEIGQRETSAKITCGEHYTAHLLPSQTAETTQLDTDDPSDFYINLSEGELTYLISLTAPFMSEEETRYYLNGICFEVNPEEIRTVATNGHILATRFIDRHYKSDEDTASYIVPKETIKIITPLLKNQKAMLLFNEKAVEFRIDNWCISSKLINGTFPNWRNVADFTSPYSKKIEVSASDILQLSKLDKKEFGGTLRLEFEKRKLQLRCNRFSGASVSIHRNGKFPSFETKGFNRLYLRDIAKAFGSENLIFDLTPEPGDHVSITSDNTEDNGYVILMPIRV